MPQNAFGVIVCQGEKTLIETLQKSTLLQAGKCYVTNMDERNKALSIIQQYGKKDDNVWYFNNIFILISELDMQFQQYDIRKLYQLLQQAQITQNSQDFTIPDNAYTQII
jgi:hypothetical protein